MRQYCPHCGYPSKTCLCSAVSLIKTEMQFVIIQHKREAFHAKNTARLVTLAMPHTKIVQVNKTPSNMMVSKALAESQSPALIYSSETSAPLEHVKAANKLTHDCYVLLDGSWKQAFGMLQTLPVLQALPHYHFQSAPVTGYQIRHTQLASSLSTLEAVAYTLQTVTAADVSPLYLLQTAMQANW